MSISLWDVVISFAIMVIVLFYLLKKIVSHRTSKDIWKLYSNISEKTDLEVKDSMRLISTWPNLFGKVGGKRAYIHPDKGNVKKNPPKTVFAVESKIDIEDDIIVTDSESSAPEDTYDLDVPSLNNYKYEVYGVSKLDEEKVDDLFSKKVAGKINSLIEDDQENFRGIIFEPGLVMFSTFNVDIDEEECMDILKKLSDIVEELEEGFSDLNEELVSPRLYQISEGTKATTIKSAVMILLLGLGGFLLYRTYLNFSLIFLNIAIGALIIGLLNLYSTASTTWKYQ